VDGRALVNFSSNDYLGLANHPAIRAAARDAIDLHGVGAGASPLVSGFHAAHREAEERFARFTGVPRALLFPSGYAANLGILTALADRSAEIFGDKLNHACLNDGAMLSRATHTRYAHLDLRAQKLGERAPRGQRIELDEDVFRRLARHSARLAIDERGDFAVAEKALNLLRQPAAEAPAKGKGELSPEERTTLLLSSANVALLQGKYEEAVATLESAEDDAFSGKPGGVFEKCFMAGLAHRKLGHEAEAQAAFSKAKEQAEAEVRAAPNDAPRNANLARALARLGKKDAAIAQAKHATELLPESVDAFAGPEMTAAQHTKSLRRLYWPTPGKSAWLHC
jgi:tetratricopeptide (TPR) repeat protein